MLERKGMELEMVPIEQESEHRAWFSGTCSVRGEGAIRAALDELMGDVPWAWELMVEPP